MGVEAHYYCSIYTKYVYIRVTAIVTAMLMSKQNIASSWIALHLFSTLLFMTSIFFFCGTNEMFRTPDTVIYTYMPITTLFILFMWEHCLKVVAILNC